MADRADMLIENWFPFETVGAECMRERGASSALPPLYFLHVWWARRPLTVSRAAILASILPIWSAEWPEPLRTTFPTEKSYQQWFLRACGIFGDPVAGRKLIDWANDRGIKLATPPYSHKRAFTVNPDGDTLGTIAQLTEHAWGKRRLSMLDPFAGGGSIPFEALRYGLDAHANELNPVATVILKATVQYPAEYGQDLTGDLRKYGSRLALMVHQRLEPFFPGEPMENVHAYIWARTIACPYTGKPVPLSPNWWLQKGSDPVAVRPKFHDAAREASFEIVRGKEACARVNPDAGTVKRGNGISPWAQNQPIDGDYIKAEAQAGRMGQQLYAVALKKKGGFIFRTATAADAAAVTAAEDELAKKLPSWDAKGWVPREPYPRVSNDARPLHYGMPTWGDFFSPRQLLSMCTLVEVYHEVAELVRQDLAEERARAVLTYLAFVIDKSADRDSYMARWVPQRGVLANTFDRHDFSFKWSYGEFDASRNMLPWAVEQVVDAYEGIAKLVRKRQTTPERSCGWMT
jgi:putative DNA methylase